MWTVRLALLHMLLSFSDPWLRLVSTKDASAGRPGVCADGVPCWEGRPLLPPPLDLLILSMPVEETIALNRPLEEAIDGAWPVCSSPNVCCSGLESLTSGRAGSPAPS
jgi:hypothetical protein